VNAEEVVKNSEQLSAQPASLRQPLTLLKSSASFLFVPIPFMDNGSFFLNLQSYESPIWYLFYILLLVIIIGLLRGTVKRDFTTIAASVFSVLFVIESSLVEVNVGTSIRHRAVLMIGILVAIVNQRRVKSDGHHE
jgi:peptidoglycan/LPS O-acetylase OafA/YrhL